MPLRKRMAFPSGLMESFSNSYPPAEPHCATELFVILLCPDAALPASQFFPIPTPTPKTLSPRAPV